MNFGKLPFISYLILILILTGRVIYLQNRQVNTGMGRSENGANGRWLLPVFLLVFLLWIFEISRAAIGFKLTVLPEFLTSLLTNSYYFKGFGAVYIVIGLIGITITLLHFGNSLRFGLQKDNKGKLVTTGIFSLSRNPFFLSLEIYFLGITIMLPSIFFIGFTLSVFIGIHYFIRKEERFLLENYGDEYRRYMEKTRRYL
jgi:protein-S-isoprenylcysteine O-methyltransferase Ste14